MRLFHPPASLAVLLLSSNALLAQGTSTAFDHVFVDVGGTALQIPAALASEACHLEESAVQRVAIARLEESGLAADVVQALFADADDAAQAAALRNEGLPASDETDAAEATGANAPASMAETTGAYASDYASMGATDTGIGGLQVGAVEVADAPAPGGRPVAVADMNRAASTPAPGSEPASVTDPARASLGTIETAAADTTAVPDAGVSAGRTMDSGAARHDQMLALAVCRIDLSRAGDLGIQAAGGTYAVD